MGCVETEDRYGIQFCNRQKLVVERGQGTVVWDDKGARYLDFTSGWGVTCLGHAHPVIVEAVCRQAGKVMQNPNSGFTYSPARAQLLEQMQRILPADLSRLFFVNSGAEANDAALKLARKISGRERVISTRASFHGRTFNTLSVSGGPENARSFTSRQTDTLFVPFGDLQALEGAIDQDTAAFIVEPVQGEGGVRIPESSYLQSVSRLCREKSVLLIVDEIQTGFARTGAMFALEHSGEVRPDFLTLGKGLAGGFPMAGLAVTERVAAAIGKGDHGGTYCGNPLGCAVAAAVVGYLVDNDIAGRVKQTGGLLLQGLDRLQRRFPSLIREARGIGLLTALELVDDELVAELTGACLQRGLLVTPTRNGIIRLIPDLLVSEVHIEQALDILESAMQAVQGRVAAASQAGIVCGSDIQSRENAK